MVLIKCRSSTVSITHPGSSQQTKRTMLEHFSICIEIDWLYSSYGGRGHRRALHPLQPDFGRSEDWGTPEKVPKCRSHEGPNYCYLRRCVTSSLTSVCVCSGEQLIFYHCRNESLDNSLDTYVLCSINYMPSLRKPSFTKTQSPVPAPRSPQNVRWGHLKMAMCACFEMTPLVVQRICVITN